MVPNGPRQVAHAMGTQDAIVTGAASGIGLEVARGLLAQGWRVTAAVRDVDKARARLPDADAMHLDLSRFASVRAFAERYKAKHDKFALLVNNAGLHTATRRLTEDGNEWTLQVNHLGHFLLTRELLPLLKAGAPSRVVNVASEAHRGGRLDLDDLNAAGSWSGLRAYTQSKLANIEFTYELARRLAGTGVDVNAAHPGSVRSGWARGPGSGLFRFAVAAASPFLLSPSAAAKRILRVATDPALAGVTGQYFVRGKARRSAPWSYREEDWTRLWHESERLTSRNGT